MLLQLTINGVYLGAICLLIAIGFSIIFIPCKFFNFAHAAYFTLGAYSTFLFCHFAETPFYLSIPLGILFSSVVGCLTELLIYRPLRNKKASNLVLLLTSLGIYIVLQNLISILFGDDTKSIRSGIVHEGLDIWGARITPVQIITICVSIVLTVVLVLLLRLTKFGKAIRAVANDPGLASVSGINSDRVILGAFALGAALAGVAGILVALDVDMNPTMGMKALLIGVVAVIIGGKKSIWGIALGALLIGFAQNFGVIAISSQWQDTIVFVILLTFLFFRPQGFFGGKVKRTEV